MMMKLIMNMMIYMMIGPIPSSVGNLSSLVGLGLQYNSLTGK